MKRGDIWLVRLDPTVGSEIRKTRPCLIVSPDELNGRLQSVTGLPLTSGSRAAPFRVPVRFKGKDGFVLADQIRTLDRQRLVSRLGKIDAATLAATLAVLRAMFADPLTDTMD